MQKTDKKQARKEEKKSNVRDIGENEILKEFQMNEDSE